MQLMYISEFIRNTNHASVCMGGYHIRTTLIVNKCCIIYDLFLLRKNLGANLGDPRCFAEASHALLFGVSSLFWFGGPFCWCILFEPLWLIEMQPDVIFFPFPLFAPYVHAHLIHRRCIFSISRLPKYLRPYLNLSFAFPQRSSLSLSL